MPDWRSTFLITIIPVTDPHAVGFLDRSCISCLIKDLILKGACAITVALTTKSQVDIHWSLEIRGVSLSHNCFVIKASGYIEQSCFDFAFFLNIIWLSQIEQSNFPIALHNPSWFNILSWHLCRPNKMFFNLLVLPRITDEGSMPKWAYISFSFGKILSRSK